MNKQRLLSFITLMLVMACVMPSSMYAQDTIYLPLVGNATTAQTANSPQYWPDGSEKADGIPPIDIFNLSDCTPEYYAQKAKENAPMDLNSPDACMGKSTKHEMTDVPQVPNAETDSVGAADVLMSRKYSLNQFYCPGCSSSYGLTGVYAMLSPQTPTLGSGKSWNNMWYANYATIGNDTTVTCQNSATTLSRAIIGVGIGRLTLGSTLTTPTVYFELLRHGSCSAYSTSIVPPANVALYPYVNIYKDANGSTSSFWTGRVYYSGAWTVLFTHEEFAFTTTGHLVNVGQEIGSDSADHATMTVPLNFASRIAIRPYGGNYIPWYDSFMPATVQGKSSVIATSPLNSQGVIVGGPDFTSRASTAP